VQLLFNLVWGNHTRLRTALHQQYRQPFPQPRDRVALQTLARELRDSSPWYEALWQRRERLQHMPTLLLWGLRDPLFTTRHLTRWQALFPTVQTVTFPTAGHFVQFVMRRLLGSQHFRQIKAW
jgi:haloalkane dehalogenase